MDGLTSCPLLSIPNWMNQTCQILHSLSRFIILQSSMFFFKTFVFLFFPFFFLSFSNLHSPTFQPTMATDSDTDDNASVFTRSTAPTEWTADSQRGEDDWDDDDDDGFSIGSLYATVLSIYLNILLLLLLLVSQAHNNYLSLVELFHTVVMETDRLSLCRRVC